MIRIPSHHGALGKLPPENPDVACIDDNGLPSYIGDDGQCVLAKCPPEMAACGGWCVGCGPFATINLNDCGCDCLPGYVPADVETPGAGCMKTYDSAGIVYYDGAPGGRPPSGIAPPLANNATPPHDDPATTGGNAASGSDNTMIIVGGVALAATVGLLIWRPWR